MGKGRDGEAGSGKKERRGKGKGEGEGGDEAGSPPKLKLGPTRTILLAPALPKISTG